MKENKSKAPLVLMEQLIMVLVFALAAAVCIQAYALTGTLSRKLVRKDHAMMVGQSMAEIVKACRGDKNKILAETDGFLEGERILVCYDEDWNVVQAQNKAAYRAEFETTETTELCHYGIVSVEDKGDGKELFSLKIAWQGESTDE